MGSSGNGRSKMAADLQKFLFKSKFLRKNTVPRTITIVLVALGYILVCIEGQECEVECQHGRCVENKCVCDSGWEGNSCQFCGGRVRYVLLPLVFYFVYN